MPSWRTANASCDDDVHLPTAAEDGHSSVLSRHPPVEILDCSVTEADEYAELLDAKVKRALDIHAPLRTCRRRSGQHHSRQLSDEARHSKRLRR